MLFRIVDLASHCSLAHSELVDDHLGATPEDLRRYSRVVSEAYRAADRAREEILAAFGETNVLVISDHGFAIEKHNDGSRLYHHLRAPSGVFLAAWPGWTRLPCALSILPLTVASEQDRIGSVRVGNPSPLVLFG